MDGSGLRCKFTYMTVVAYISAFAAYNVVGRFVSRASQTQLEISLNIDVGVGLSR